MRQFKQFITEVVVFSDIRKSNKLGFGKLLGKDKFDLLFSFQKKKQIFKPMGKIGAAEVFHSTKDQEHHYLVFEGDKSTIYFVAKTYGPKSQQVDSIAATGNSVKAKDLYAFLVKNGVDIVSDVMQSEGGKAIWRSLSKERGVTVFGWDGERAYNLGAKLDDYTDLETYDRPGEEYDDEEEVKTRRKMLLIATKKR